MNLLVLDPKPTMRNTRNSHEFSIQRSRRIHVVCQVGMSLNGTEYHKILGRALPWNI